MEPDQTAHAESPPPPPSPAIHEEDWVVLESSDNRHALGHVTRTSSARIGKRKRKLANLISHKWGTLFSISTNDTLHAIPESKSHELPREDDMSTARNNRLLMDDTRNQNLRQEAILELQRDGVRGEDLVQAVARNSSTFKGKTPFSQAKYLERKRQKFDLRVRAVRPTARTLCETYLERSPDKTMHLRPDALGMLLSYAGVRAGARVLLYENCTGLLTGACAERMGGIGQILNVFSGGAPPGVEVIRMLNLKTRANAIIHTPIEILGALQKVERADAQPLRYVTRADAEKEERDEEAKHEPSAKRAEAIAKRVKRGLVKEWIRSGCDCLLVATRYDVVKVFDTLLRYVAPSGGFAAYCTHLQDASDLHYALQLSMMATRIELMEVGLVTHQVLPGRSHPAMTDSATGGYIVSGIRIAAVDTSRYTKNDKDET